MAIFSTRLCASAALAFTLVSLISAQEPTGQYLIQNVESGLILNIQKANATPGAHIIEYPITQPIGNYGNQIWTWNAAGNTLTAVKPAVGFECEHGSFVEPCVVTVAPADVQLLRFNGNYIIQAPDSSGAVLTGTGHTSGDVTMSPGVDEQWTTHQQWTFIEFSS